MSRQRRLTIASLALVVAIAGGACGGKSGGSEKAQDKKDAAASTAADASADAAVDGSATTAPAKGKTDTKASTATTAKAGDTAAASKSLEEQAKEAGIDLKQFEGDYVFGSPRAMSGDDPRPPGCSMKYGEMCTMQITGTYQLKSTDVASIQVGAYEDGATEPAFHTALPNAKKGSSHWYIDKFPYQAREGVKEMQILVKLLDVKGKELARGKPTTFPIELFQKL